MEGKEGQIFEYPKNPYRAMRDWIESVPPDQLTREAILGKFRSFLRRPDEYNIREDLEGIALFLSRNKDTERSRRVFASIDIDSQ